MVILWALTITLHGLVSSYQGLLAARFSEGGLLPGLMLVKNRFYKRDQIQMRMTPLFTTVSLVGAFSGLLAFGVIRMDGGE